jgi:hypothetical protein
VRLRRAGVVRLRRAGDVRLRRAGAGRAGSVRPLATRRVMRTGTCIALIAAGAMLRFAVGAGSGHGLHVHAAGVIVIGAGELGLLSLLVWGPLNPAWRRRAAPAVRKAAARPTPPKRPRRPRIDTALRSGCDQYPAALPGRGYASCPHRSAGRAGGSCARAAVLAGAAARAWCQLPFLAVARGRTVRPWPARTWMCLACVSGALGTRIGRTPSWTEASILSASMWLGRVIERRKAP